MSLAWVDFEQSIITNNPKQLEKALQTILSHDKERNLEERIFRSTLRVTNTGFVIKILSRCPSIVNFDQGELLSKHSCEGNVDVVKRILDLPELDVSIIKNCILRTLVFNKKVDTIKLLVEDPRVDIGEYGEVCLFLASTKGSLDMLKYIYGLKKYDINKCPLSECLSSRNLENAAWLSKQPEALAAMYRELDEDIGKDKLDEANDIIDKEISSLFNCKDHDEASSESSGDEASSESSGDEYCS